MTSDSANTPTRIGYLCLTLLFGTTQLVTYGLGQISVSLICAIGTAMAWYFALHEDLKRFPFTFASQKLWQTMRNRNALLQGSAGTYVLSGVVFFSLAAGAFLEVNNLSQISAWLAAAGTVAYLCLLLFAIAFRISLKRFAHHKD